MAHAAEDAKEHVTLLTPIAKSVSTDAGVDVASMGIQGHGGMEFVEEKRTACYLRDARIAPIYESTNSIQAAQAAACRWCAGARFHRRTT